MKMLEGDHKDPRQTYTMPERGQEVGRGQTSCRIKCLPK